VEVRYEPAQVKASGGGPFTFYPGGHERLHGTDTKRMGESRIRGQKKKRDHDSR